MSKPKASASSSLDVPRSEWVRLPADEWRRRLVAARELALKRLAASGLDLDADCGDDVPMVCDIILDHETGASLIPSLARTRKRLDAVVEQLGNPSHTLPNEEHSLHLSDRISAYALDALEAAFIFGVITGTGVRWPLIEAMQPPSAPPMRKGPRS